MREISLKNIDTRPVLTTVKVQDVSFRAFQLLAVRYFLVMILIVQFGSEISHIKNYSKVQNV